MNYSYRDIFYQNVEKKKLRTFSSVKPIYRLNKVTHILEKTSEVRDVDEIILSCIDNTLDRILERFSPQEALLHLQRTEIETMRDDLDLLVEASTVANEYREKYDLPDDMETKKVFEVVDRMSKEIQEKNKAYENSRKKQENIIVGGKEDAQAQDEQESKSQVVSQDGKENTEKKPS